MDSVVENKYKNVLSSLNIEVSKKLDGEYDAEEIVSAFQNFFFNKMFLDITAIKNYKDITNLQKLSMAIDMDKVILLLDKDDEISDSNLFLSQLVGMGIYNFTKDENALMYLYNNPNVYRDVAYYQNTNNVNLENIPLDTEDDNSINIPSKKILGIKNITTSAGATTLCYAIKKVLSSYYNVKVIELDKEELKYFNDPETISIKNEQLENTIKNNNDTDMFIIDLNKSSKDSICSEILYLIEPTTIKLNELSMVNPKIFNDLKGKNIILNKSLLDSNDIANFEVESKLKVFYNLRPFNDKKDVSNIILPLLSKIGYVKEEITEDNPIEEEEEDKSIKKSFFNLFKRNNILIIGLTFIYFYCRIML